MSDYTPAEQSFDIWKLLAALRAAWLVIAVCAVLGMLIGFGLALRATPLYTASLSIVPAGGGIDAAPSSALGGLSGALSGFGINLPKSESGSDFIIFPEVLRSSAVAAEILKHKDYLRAMFPGEYDAETQSFQPKGGALYFLRKAFWGIFGQPAYFPPSASRIQNFLGTEVKISEATTSTPVTTLSYTNADPAFGRRFLAFIYQVTDNQLRQWRVERAKVNSDYLEGKLNSVSAVDYRSGLINQLMPQQMQVMLSNPRTAFSARILNGPVTSDRPDSPRPVLYILFGLLLGAAFAAALVALKIFFPQVPNPLTLLSR